MRKVSISKGVTMGKSWEKNRGPACIRANTHVRRSSIPAHETHHQAFTLTNRGEWNHDPCLKVPKLSLYCRVLQLISDISVEQAGKGKNQKYGKAPSALSFVKLIYKYSEYTSAWYLLCTQGP